MKTMKGFILTIVIVFCIISVQTHTDAGSRIEPNKGTEIIQEAVLSANEKLYSTFEMREDGHWVYPDAFSGVYAKPDKLIVFLTDCSVIKQKEFLKRIPGCEDAVVFRKALYSLKELEDGAESIGTMLLENKCRVSVWYVDVLSNRAIVGVSPDYYEQAEQLLKKAGGIPAWLDLQKREVAHTEAVLRGGDGIECVQSGAGMTLGAGGYVGTNTNIVTCGHGFSAYGNTAKKNNDSNAFGYVITRVYPSPNGSSIGDYSLVPLYSGNSILPEV